MNNPAQFPNQSPSQWPNQPNTPPPAGGYPQPGQQYGGYQQPGQQFGGYSPPPKNGMSTGAKVAIGLGLAFFLLLGGCVAVFAVVGSRFTSAIEDLAENSQLAEEAATITSCQTGPTGRAEATVEFTSPFESQKSVVSVEVNFFDGSEFVGAESVDFQNIEPGETAEETTSQLNAPADVADLNCEIVGAFVF